MIRVCYLLQAVVEGAPAAAREKVPENISLGKLGGANGVPCHVAVVKLPPHMMPVKYKAPHVVLRWSIPLSMQGFRDSFAKHGILAVDI